MLKFDAVRQQQQLRRDRVVEPAAYGRILRLMTRTLMSAHPAACCFSTRMLHHGSPSLLCSATHGRWRTRKDEAAHHWAAFTVCIDRSLLETGMFLVSYCE